tara:strand:+ start:1202 stop:2119 length:918 start_codon:yes stop_codon:yes gene_type:complete
MKKNLTILCYHGVTKIRDQKGIENFSGKHLFFKEFEKQIKSLKRKNCKFLNFDEVVYKIENNSPFEKKSICITFDDGFKNNFEVAAPILKRNNIPAIFFLCPLNIEKQEMFWVDKIEDCINRTNKKEITINLNKKRKFLIRSKKDKKKCINKIKNFCKNTKYFKKDKIIDQLIKKTCIIPSIKSSQNYHLANWKILKKTLKNKLFSIGGHSLCHDIYSNLDDIEIEKNIKGTKKLIKKNLNYSIKYFSYPEGQINHFNKTTIKELKNNGIKSCPTAIKGKNSHKENLFYLKRIMVGFNNTKMPTI